jgi:hypothetical protein
MTDDFWLAVGDGAGVVTLPDPTYSRWLYSTRECDAPRPRSVIEQLAPLDF